MRRNMSSDETWIHHFNSESPQWSFVWVVIGFVTHSWYSLDFVLNDYRLFSNIKKSLNLSGNEISEILTANGLKRYLHFQHICRKK